MVSIVNVGIIALWPALVRRRYRSSTTKDPKNLQADADHSGRMQIPKSVFECMALDASNAPHMGT